MYRHIGLGMGLSAFFAGGATAAPIGADEAAVMGGWSAADAAGVVGVHMQPIALSRGCLRYVRGPGFDLDDHADPKRGLMWTTLKVRPGTYAAASVRWTSRGYPTTLFGESLQLGPVYTVEVAPGAVTLLGAWPLTRTFAHHYDVGPPELAASAEAASRMAKDAGPLRVARWRQAVVAGDKDACPAIADAPP